jgi:DNA-binding cell septation regulator SpoVG
MRSNGNIKVVEMKSMNGDRPLKAFATVQINDWVIYDWRIIQQPGQRAWVSVPQVSWKDNDGKVKYKALLSIPGELKQRIEVAILSAWEKEKGNAHS